MSCWQGPVDDRIHRPRPPRRPWRSPALWPIQHPGEVDEAREVGLDVLAGGDRFAGEVLRLPIIGAGHLVHEIGAGPQRMVLEAVAAADLVQHLIGEGGAVVVDLPPRADTWRSIRFSSARQRRAAATSAALPAGERSLSFERAALPRASVSSEAAASGDIARYSSMCRESRAVSAASPVGWAPALPAIAASAPAPRRTLRRWGMGTPALVANSCSK